MRRLDVIILAGGFAKRMWPLTKDRPKHLLDIAGRPMLCHTIKPLLELDEIGRIFISTNRAFEEQFQDFIRDNYPDADLELMIEPTLEEGQKLGSVGGLGYLIRERQLSYDTMIIGGDNLFEFSHLDALKAFRE
ncbi:MAG: NDP-sugar synthase, partial [Thermoplasmata archaeon]|nr:NDP-sugar synthase [Thermoplasmata archaeon]